MSFQCKEEHECSHQVILQSQSLGSPWYKIPDGKIWIKLGHSAITFWRWYTDSLCTSCDLKTYLQGFHEDTTPALRTNARYRFGVGAQKLKFHGENQKTKNKRKERRSIQKYENCSHHTINPAGTPSKLLSQRIPQDQTVSELCEGGDAVMCPFGKYYVHHLKSLAHTIATSA